MHVRVSPLAPRSSVAVAGLRRRLAAMGVAERVAAEQGCALGEAVGYQASDLPCRRSLLSLNLLHALCCSIHAP